MRKLPILISLRTQPVIQRLTEKSQRTLAGQHIANDEHVHAPYAQLPPALANAHAQLAQAAEAIAARAQPAVGISMHTALADRVPDGANAQEAWLPDIYHLGSPGLSGTTERCAGAVALTPFFSAPPSVAEDRIFKFDDGELSVGLLEETIHMAWF